MLQTFLMHPVSLVSPVHPPQHSNLSIPPILPQALYVQTSHTLTIANPIKKDFFPPSSSFSLLLLMCIPTHF